MCRRRNRPLLKNWHPYMKRKVPPLGPQRANQGKGREGSCCLCIQLWVPARAERRWAPSRDTWVPVTTEPQRCKDPKTLSYRTARDRKNHSCTFVFFLSLTWILVWVLFIYLYTLFFSLITWDCRDAVFNGTPLAVDISRIAREPLKELCLHCACNANRSTPDASLELNAATIK